MKKSADVLAKECKRVADIAKDGCPALTYQEMTPLLEQVLALAPSMNEQFPFAINSVIKEILEAQKMDDLLKISDFLEFELVYILNNYSK
ncbi:MAG: hypothetical protein ACI4M9_07620 [Succinivibrio sp.]